MFKDLLFYERTTGVAEIYSTKRGQIAHVDGLSNLDPGWTHIVQGYSAGLLCYNASTGAVQLWSISIGFTGVRLVMDRPAWRKGWTHIVAGNFVNQTSNDFLFYDAAAGVGEFHTFAASDLQPVSVHENWRQSWAQIVSGSFGGNDCTDLLFYDPSAGVGEFYAVSQGQLSLLRTHQGWRQSWTRIVPIEHFRPSTPIHSHLLFYDATTGVGEFYSTNAGNISNLRTYTGWRDSWAVVAPGHFGVETDTVLMFYDRIAGVGEFYGLRTNAAMNRLTTSDNWRRSWDLIVPGFYVFVSLGEL